MLNEAMIDAARDYCDAATNYVMLSNPRIRYICVKLKRGRRVRDRDTKRESECISRHTR